MKRTLFGFGLAIGLVILRADAGLAQAPASMICKMERIASAGLDSTGKTEASADTDDGEIVLSGLDSNRPTASGNIGAQALVQIKKNDDAVWFAELVRGGFAEGVGIVTLFFKSHIVLYSKQEVLTTGDGDKPFGLVEIGRCRPLK